MRGHLNTTTQVVIYIIILGVGLIFGFFTSDGFSRVEKSTILLQ